MPGSAFPPLGRLGLTSPVSPVLCLATTAICPSWVASLFAFASQYPSPLSSGLCPVSFLRLTEYCRKCGLSVPGLLVCQYSLSSGLLGGDMMALSSSRVTPVDTCPVLRPRWCPVHSPFLFLSRTAAFQRLHTVGFLRWLLHLVLPQLYPFRGSIARPVSLLHPAPYSRYRVCTWISLPACWLDFDRMGLSPTG